MEQYNKVLKDVLESNKLKFLMMLHSSQDIELNDLKITDVKLIDEGYVFYTIRMTFKSSIIENLTLDKDFYGNHSNDEVSLIYYSSGGLINSLEHRLKFYFSHLENDTKESGNQKAVINEFFQELFQKVHAKFKENEVVFPRTISNNPF